MFTGSTVTGSDAAYALNCYYGVAFVDAGEQRATGGNHYPDGVAVTYENTQLCFSPPNGYSVSGLHINQSDFRTGATCYPGTNSARVDFGIAKFDMTEDAVDSVTTGCTGTRIIVPDGSVPDGTEFIFIPNTEVRGVALLGQSVIRASCDITTNTGQTTFEPPIYICITHTTADILAAGGAAANLSVGYFNTESNSWQPYDNAPADVGNADETCSSSDHLTQVGLMARVPTALPATGGALWSAATLLFLSMVFLLALGLWRLYSFREEICAYMRTGSRKNIDSNP